MKSIIHTPTGNLENSLSFYKKLEFKTLSTKPHVVSDGKAIIEINPDRYTRAGVKLFRTDWSNEITVLRNLTAITQLPNGFLLSDPSAVWIYLIEEESHVNYKQVENSFSKLGNFIGLSLESTDMERSEKIWSALGFKVNGSASQGWISCASDDGLSINVMKPLTCPHLFINPSMTYFNGKENNPTVIQHIRDLNISITEEITHFNNEGKVDNVIIQDPGGYGFFIFND